MHELAITEGILNQSIAEAKRQGATRILKIKLQLGAGQAIVPECVQFYFDQLKSGTIAGRAKLDIETIPVRVRCPECHKDFEESGEDTGVPIPACRCRAGAEIVSGQELVIEYLEVETPKKTDPKRKS